MTRLDPDWLEALDEAMLKSLAIDHVDAGTDDRELAWYSDLPAKDAAKAYGQDYDMCRVDTFWPPRRLAMNS
jgi:hypothetical protein